MKILCLLTAVLLFCGASTASAACRPRPGDTDKFHNLVLGSFYAYDGGKRWEGDSLIEWHRDAAPTPTNWLESVALQRQGNGWKLASLHSTRMEAAPGK